MALGPTAASDDQWSSQRNHAAQCASKPSGNLLPDDRILTVESGQGPCCSSSHSPESICECCACLERQSLSFSSSALTIQDICHNRPLSYRPMTSERLDDFPAQSRRVCLAHRSPSPPRSSTGGRCPPPRVLRSSCVAFGRRAGPARRRQGPRGLFRTREPVTRGPSRA